MSSRCTRVRPRPTNPPRRSSLPAGLRLAVIAIALASGCRPAPKAPASNAPGGTISGVGFSGPAAVLHDADMDRYYVGSANGAPDAADDNGFISIVSPERDSVVALKWIDGAAPEVNLSAPRGMAAVGQFLYVTDLATIRRFNRRSGAPEGEIPVPGAVSLDGMDASGDGTLYFTDSGDSTRAGAVYRLALDGRLDTLARGPELGHPTGIAVAGDTVWVVSREGEMYRVAGGKRLDVVRLPSAGLEGLVVFGGDAFVSTAEGRAVLRGKLGGPFAPLLAEADAPGGIGHDLWRNRILVPLYGKNQLRVVRLAF